MVQISAHADHREEAGPVTGQTYTEMLASGAEYAEFDIRRTADGVLVAYHDARAGPGGPPVSGLEYPALCERLGYAVPRVDEVMALLAGRLAGHLDLKEAGYEAEVTRLASAVLGTGNYVITSLEDASVAAIKQASPQTRTALSLGRSLRGVPRHRWAAVRRGELFPLHRVRACGADAVAVNYRLARLGVTRACHRHGIGVMVWTVDASPLIDRFLSDPRIDVLITNRPRYAGRRRAGLAAGLGAGLAAGPSAADGQDLTAARREVAGSAGPPSRPARRG